MIKWHLKGWVDYEVKKPAISDSPFLVYCDHQYYSAVRFGQMLENGDIITLGEPNINVMNDIITHWMPTINLPRPDCYWEPEE